MAITQSMIDIVKAEAERSKAGAVRKINIVVGQMSGFASESIQFYFNFLSRGTVMEGARLSFDVAPITGHCLECNMNFVVEKETWTCPSCDGNDIEVIGGTELFVNSIEVG